MQGKEFCGHEKGASWEKSWNIESWYTMGDNKR